jgi:hypothetical protein
MRPSRRSLGLGALAAAGLAAAPRRVRAAQGDSFSVSGKGGPYVKQVAGESFASGGGGSLGLASDAVNLGRYQTSRLRMPQTEAKVAALLNGIDAKWPYGRAQPLQVHILGLDYYNAYSLPDGSIVVAFGLLDQAQSDDEVAFVLAHELGHVRLGHFASHSGAGMKATLPNRNYLAAAVLAASAANAGALGAATQAGATNDYLHFLTNAMVEPNHTREQEDQADCIGYDLSLAAAYSADAASARVFDTIQADQTRHQALVDTLNSQLKSQLSSAITAGNATNLLLGGASGLRGNLLMGAGRLAFGVAAARQSEPPPQHRPPADRKRGMAQYSSDAYPDGAPLRDEQHTWLASVRATAEFAQAKAAVEAVTDAKRARSQALYPQAAVAMAKARATSFGQAPLVLNEAARLADDMGDPAGAEKLYGLANASPDQTVDGYVDHVRMLYRTKQNDRAMLVAREGVGRFGNDDKPFIALMISVARQAGHDDEMQQHLARCESYDNEALLKDCRVAAGQKPDGDEGQSGGPSFPTSLPFGLPHL